MTMTAAKAGLKLEKLMTTKETVWSDYFTQESLDAFSFKWVEGEWKCRSIAMECFMLYPIMTFVALPYFDDLVKGMKKIIVEVSLDEVSE